MVCFPALQFNTAKKQFMATRKVPIAVSRQRRKLSFNLAHGNQQADLHSWRSFLPTGWHLCSLNSTCRCNKLT